MTKEEWVERSNLICPLIKSKTRRKRIRKYFLSKTRPATEPGKPWKHPRVYAMARKRLVRELLLRVYNLLSTIKDGKFGKGFTTCTPPDFYTDCDPLSLNDTAEGRMLYKILFKPYHDKLEKLYNFKPLQFETRCGYTRDPSHLGFLIAVDGRVEHYRFQDNNQDVIVEA